MSENLVTDDDYRAADDLLAMMVHAAASAQLSTLRERIATVFAISRVKGGRDAQVELAGQFARFAEEIDSDA